MLLVCKLMHGCPPPRLRTPRVCVATCNSERGALSSQQVLTGRTAVAKSSAVRFPEARVWIPALSLMSHITLGKLFLLYGNSMGGKIAVPFSSSWYETKIGNFPSIALHGA